MDSTPKQRSETRAWLEKYGWRFMGYNHWHRTAYYANLNLNTMQTFAQHRAVELSRDRAVDIEYWPTHDPTLVDGSREARLEAYREVRDALADAIKQRFGAPSTFGG